MTRLDLIDESSDCLDPSATEALFAEALKAQAPVTFYKDAGRSRLMLAANLVEQSRDHLELMGPSCDEFQALDDIGDLACALLVMNQRRYTFMASLARMGKRQGRSYWRMEIPSDIRPLIRRTPRLRPRTSTGVSVRPIHGPDVTVAAALLNVSEDGMACRVPAVSDDGITRDRMVQLTFRLSETDEPFDLPADVIHRQAAGTEGFDIVGLQFCRRRATKDALRRLARALARMTS